jgi:hypothetical protein
VETLPIGIPLNPLVVRIFVAVTATQKFPSQSCIIKGFTGLFCSGLLFQGRLTGQSIVGRGDCSYGFTARLRRSAFANAASWADLM